jgi:hypothetical protein
MYCTTDKQVIAGRERHFALSLLLLLSLQENRWCGSETG